MAPTLVQPSMPIAHLHPKQNKLPMKSTLMKTMKKNRRMKHIEKQNPWAAAISRPYECPSRSCTTAPRQLGDQTPSPRRIDPPALGDILPKSSIPSRICKQTPTSQQYKRSLAPNISQISRAFSVQHSETSHSQSRLFACETGLDQAVSDVRN